MRRKQQTIPIHSKWLMALGLLIICMKGIFSQNYPTIQILPTAACLTDSVELQAKTDAAFIGWEVQGTSSARISTPLQLTTFVRQTATTTYRAIAGNFGANLVTNGSFENDTSGFSSEYKYVQTVTKNSTYTLCRNPKENSSAYVVKKDKTTGNGFMLMADGSTDSGKSFYKTKVKVEKGTNYHISFWISNIHTEFTKSAPDTSKASVPVIESAFGTMALDTFSLPKDTAWHLVSFQWTANSTDSLIFRLRSLNRGVKGNDLVLDEISILPYFLSSAAITLPVCYTGPVISPDGDGVADEFYVKEQGLAKVIDMGGNVIKEFSSPAAWDGSHRNGTLADAGYYAIVVNNEKVHRVSLLR